MGNYYSYFKNILYEGYYEKEIQLEKDGLFIVKNGIDREFNNKHKNICEICFNEDEYKYSCLRCINNINLCRDCCFKHANKHNRDDKIIKKKSPF
jgi:hypothetical protein